MSSARAQYSISSLSLCSVSHPSSSFNSKQTTKQITHKQQQQIANSNSANNKQISLNNKCNCKYQQAKYKVKMTKDSIYGRSLTKEEYLPIEKKYKQIRHRIVGVRSRDGIVCHIPLGFQTGTGERGYITHIGKREYTLRRLVFLSERKKFPARGLEVTVLCSNPFCCKPGHLHAEAGLNKLREKCFGGIRIDNSGKVFDVCKHNPKCAKITDLRKYKKVDVSTFESNRHTDNASYRPAFITKDRYLKIRRMVALRKYGPEGSSEEKSLPTKKTRAKKPPPDSKPPVSKPPDSKPPDSKKQSPPKESNKPPSKRMSARERKMRFEMSEYKCSDIEIVNPRTYPTRARKRAEVEDKFAEMEEPEKVEVEEIVEESESKEVEEVLNNFGLYCK